MFLLDTDVLSEIIKKNPSPLLFSKLREHPAETMVTASICIMELRTGAVRRLGTPSLWSRIEEEIIARVQVFPFGHAEALIAGNLLAHVYQQGTPIGIEDVMIAATAIRTGSIVVTGNIRHFSRIPDLRVENWLR